MSSAEARPEFTQPRPNTAGAPQAGPTRFWLHALGWVLFYLTVVVAWGQRNSWPDDLILCVLVAPVNAVVISTLYAVYGFGTRVDSHRAQQEQLIAALVLAVGIASGQLLLMNLGLAALAIAWLRPARPGVDWTEWLKIPLILFTALPFWLDFQGNPSPLVHVFEDPASNPTLQLPLALTTTQNRLLAYCALLSLVMLLHGRAFWIAVPCLPAFLLAIAALPKWIPAWATLPPTFRHIAPWMLGILLLIGVSWLAVRLDAACRRLVSGETLRRWFEERRYPPWLAVLVVIAAQWLPIRSVAFTPRHVVVGSALLLTTLLLITLRRRSRPGPIHSRSVALVAGALLLNLIAEFTTTDLFRQLAIAFVLIGLLSWHRFWHLRVFLTAGSLAIVLLGFPQDIAPAMANPEAVFAARIGIAALLLVLLTRFTLTPQPPPGDPGYPEHAWVPSKRFAFILLGLMMLFQTAAAFWPEHQMPVAPDAPHPTQFGESTPPPQMPATGQAASHQLLDRAGIVQVSIAYPQKNPYLLESPERTLQRHGWRVVERLRIPQPHGEATALRIVRDGQFASAIWWFDQGPRRFSNHLYARRVLWSSWHLADRQLRQVRLESLALTRPTDLAAFAARHDWFTRLDPGLKPRHP